MWFAIASALLVAVVGVAGWWGTNFFAKPYLDFRNLKSQVHEEITRTGNVGAMVAHTPDYKKTVDSLRRLGAKVHATNNTASRLLRWYLSIAGYNLVKAGGGLIGLSNSLDDYPVGSRALQTNSIQVGLKLRRDYNDEQLRQIQERMLHPRS